ncbi:MAG: flagellar basal body P-ring protein FlgI [Planctomycetota bacterium]
MQLITLTALLFALAPQDPGAARADVLIAPGSFDAPAQPGRSSSANFRRTTRVGVPGAVDSAGRINAKIRSLVGIRGMEENTVSGFGLVTGLSGTGDSGPLVTQLMANTLLTNNINIAPALLATANIAVVKVDGSIPAGARPGQAFDVRVSSIGDATSLVNGVLDRCVLFDPSGSVAYGTAGGSITVGGYSASGQGATTTKNSVTVGTLASGGKVERYIPTSVVTEHGYIYLDVRNGQFSFGNTTRMTERINQLFPGVAEALPDGRSIRVAVPVGFEEGDYIAYVNMLLELEVPTDNLARVVVNERTGVIVMGGDVRLRPGVIQQSSIILRVAETPEVSQPSAFSQGETTVVPRTDLNVEEGNAPLVQIGGAVTLDQVVNVLNVLGASPRDMIAIMESLVNGGMLVAELRRL